MTRSRKAALPAALAMLVALSFAWPRTVSALDRFADPDAEAVFGE